MGTYFQPMRRKFGVSTLAIALVFAAGWIRSLSSDDHFNAWIGRHSVFHLVSNNSSLAIAIAWEEEGEPNVIIENGVAFKEGLMDQNKLIDWSSFPADGLATDDFAWDSGCFGVRFATEDHDPIQVRALFVPYAYLVIPLSLLSACLLLTKPRKPNSKQVGEPTPKSVA